MDDATRERLGEDLEPGGRAAAPEPLRLVQRFINTHNHEFEARWDRLLTPARATRWLAAHGLLASRERVSAAEHRAILELRDALRDQAAARSGARLMDAQVQALNGAMERGTMVIRFDAAGGVDLQPAATGFDGTAARLAAALYTASLGGTLDRLKTCRQCGWAYYDRSKNTSARWCAMSICGNRTKNRAYRRRARGIRAKLRPEDGGRRTRPLRSVTPP